MAGLIYILIATTLVNVNINVAIAFYCVGGLGILFTVYLEFSEWWWNSRVPPAQTMDPPVDPPVAEPAEQIEVADEIMDKV